MLATLNTRSDSACEFCSGDTNLAPYAVGPAHDGTAMTAVLLCSTCTPMIEGEMDQNHLRCLGTAIWSEHDPVKVLAWRVLDRLSDQAWARDLTEQMYMDDETMNWASSGAIRDSQHKDANGATLNAGDNVVLIKDLPVKGGGFTAKRGTAVRGISLVADNPAHIEGRVEGQRIVILTEFVKKK
jgi:protein PhnA